MKKNYSMINWKIMYGKKVMKIVLRYAEIFTVAYLTGNGVSLITQKIISKYGNNGILIDIILRVIASGMLINIINEPTSVKLAEDLMDLCDIKKCIETEKILEQINNEDICISTGKAA